MDYVGMDLLCFFFMLHAQSSNIFIEKIQVAPKYSY